MPAWREARRAGSTARLNTYKDRDSDQKQMYSVGHYNFDEGKCLWCKRKKGKMKTGYLPITGPVWFCPDHKQNYDDDKIWEAARVKP